MEFKVLHTLPKSLGEIEGQSIKGGVAKGKVFRVVPMLRGSWPPEEVRENITSLEQHYDADFTPVSRGCERSQQLQCNEGQSFGQT